MNNYNINIEKAVLSTIFFNGKFYEYKQELNVDTFAITGHQDIYRAMVDLDKKDMPIDEEFVKKELLTTNKYAEHILIEILSASPTPNVLAYIKDMQEAHVHREILTINNEFASNKINSTQLITKLSKVRELYTKNNTDNIPHSNHIDLAKLSPYLKDIVTELANINAYPISMVLATVLTSMGGLIGARAKMRNHIVNVYPVIWSIIVAPSSAGAKSTLVNYTKKYIFGDLQNDLFEEYKGRLEKHEDEVKAFRNLSREDKRNEIEPEKPEPKLLIFQDDGTPEAKIKSLADNPNGGVIYYDEMRAELEKTNNSVEYKALKTKMFGSERHHKRLVNGGSIILDNPVLCENGLITEQWLIGAVHKDDVASGFMARSLWSYNQKEDFKPLEIKDHIQINDIKYAKVGEFVLNMLNIDNKEHHQFVFDKEAKDYYKEWFNETSSTSFYTETDEESTASTRLRTYVLKFALISYIFNMAYKETNIIKDDKFAIPIKYVKEAIYIANIFRDENSKVLSLFQKHNKLHKKLDDISTKIQNKIRVSKNKRITRTIALNIRGVGSSKLDELIENNIFKQEKIEKTNYIMEMRN